MFSNSEASHAELYSCLFLALRATFSETDFAQFIVTFSLNQIVEEEAAYIVCQLITNQVKFLATLYDIYSSRLKETINITDLSNGPEKDALKEDLVSKREAEHETRFSNYQLNSGKLHLHTGWTPVEFTFDGHSRTLSIAQAEASSSIYDYPGKVTSTSEMLRYLAAITTTFSVLGDVELLSGNPSLLRLVTYFIDNGRIDLDSLRVGVEDLEEWDYLYPDFDRQAGLSSPRT